MNLSAIPLEALNRFRHAASHYAVTVKSRESRLLALQADIAALRKRGVSYHAISELLKQSEIKASDTCVMNFCHRVLKERRHKPFVARRPKAGVNQAATINVTPAVTPAESPNVALPVTPAASFDVLPTPTLNAPVKRRGPRIAHVELVEPNENPN